MFLQASVCPQGVGCLPQCMPGYHPPRADTPRADTPPRYGHCCGRYASYRNAFLLHKVDRSGICVLLRSEVQYKFSKNFMSNADWPCNSKAVAPLVFTLSCLNSWVISIGGTFCWIYFALHCVSLQKCQIGQLCVITEKQESIPVGCVPPAGSPHPVVSAWGGVSARGGCLPEGVTGGGSASGPSGVCHTPFPVHAGIHTPLRTDRHLWKYYHRKLR